jgi:hypothetical protein
MRKAGQPWEAKRHFAAINRSSAWGREQSNSAVIAALSHRKTFRSKQELSAIGGGTFCIAAAQRRSAFH